MCGYGEGFLLCDDAWIPMREQAELIHGGDWDTLIVLDACRYDIFKSVNRLEGKLTEARSNAQHTLYWLKRTFPDKYDYHYVSAHPYINKMKGGFWNAIDHFEPDKIHQVWMFGWSDKLGTVHPTSVVKFVKKLDYDRAIIHFIQPHGPWIGRTKLGTEWSLADWFKTGLMGDNFVSFAKPDKTLLRVAYKDNLRLVLGVLNRFKSVFRGKTVITADHGEMLGERGYYLHEEFFHADRANPLWVQKTLKRVPWFEWEF